MTIENINVINEDVKVVTDVSKEFKIQNYQSSCKLTCHILRRNSDAFD